MVFDAYILTARRRLTVRAVRRIFLCYRLFRFPRLRQKIHPHQSTWKIVIVKGISIHFVFKARTSVTLSGFVLVGIANLLLRTLRLRAIYLSDGDCCVQRTDFQPRAGRADVSDRFWNRSFLRYASPTMPIERGLKNICGAPYSLT